MNLLAARLRELIASEGPQSVDRLRRGLRRKGYSLPAGLVDRELRQHSDLFRPTGTGAWDLAENVAPTHPPVDDTESRLDPLVSGALVDDFGVVDLETTGTDPTHDEIVQVAAVRVTYGVPADAFNRYVRTKSVELPESLRVRMGWEYIPDDDRADLADALLDLDRSSTVSLQSRGMLDSTRTS